MAPYQEGSDPEGERYRPEEICEAIAAFTDADFARVRAMACYYAKRSGMAADDLQQETFERALGSRSCRVGTNMLAFLSGVMKSIASEHPRAQKRAREKGRGEGGLV